MDRNLAWHCISEDVSVALRKESVDRNTISENPMISVNVALRKESVDRNLIGGVYRAIDISRSPQGERG